MLTDNLRESIKAYGLRDDLRGTLAELMDVYYTRQRRNAMLSDYYDGNVMVKELGIDVLPDSIKGSISLSCDWPRKAVTALADRSKFDGFVMPGRPNDTELNRLVRDCNIISAYSRNLHSQLKHGCMFATVGLAENGRPYVRFHSAENGAALWDDTHERIACGFVLSNYKRTDYSGKRYVPTAIYLHTPGEVTELVRLNRSEWAAATSATPLDRPMMEAFRYAPTGEHPLGTSRITKQVIDLTDDVLRVRLYMAVSGALFAAPQKYLLGLSDEQYDALSKSKWSTYIGSVVMSTTDDNGGKPTFGQLSPVSPQPYIDIIRNDAALFSGATGVPLHSLGIIHDNPTSAEAINAATSDLCIMAEKLNESNRRSLEAVAVMAMAVAAGKPIDGLDESQQAVEAHFKSPNVSSIAAQADAAVKIASVVPGFAETPVFFEMIGFDEATIARIESYKARENGLAALRDALNGGTGDGIVG